MTIRTAIRLLAAVMALTAGAAGGFAWTQSNAVRAATADLSSRYQRLLALRSLEALFNAAEGQLAVIIANGEHERVAGFLAATRTEFERRATDPVLNTNTTVGRDLEQPLSVWMAAATTSIRT